MTCPLIFMKQKYASYDFVPGKFSSKQNNIPKNFEYWKPGWEIVNGKLVKNEKPTVKEESLNSSEETSDVFSCNHCKFISKTETGIKIHVSRNHKKD